MKKLVSLLIVLALVLGCASALAEQAYTSVTGTFTCQVPDDYVIYSTSDIMSIANEMTSEQIQELYGVDEATANTLKAGFSSIDPATTDCIYAPDFTSNLNVITTTAQLTQEYIAQNTALLDEAITSQYGSYGIASDSVSPQGMMTVGDHDFYAIYVDAWGVTLRQYMIVTDGGHMLTFTFTGIEEEDSLSILKTVALTD